jgi:arylsulfatase A-like enzyme
VVVTADHGESFPHGYRVHSGPELYNEIIHTPLPIKLPRQHQAARSSVIAQQVDIARTLAELAGIAPPASGEDRSLLRAWHARDSAATPVSSRTSPRRTVSRHNVCGA